MSLLPSLSRRLLRRLLRGAATSFALSLAACGGSGPDPLITWQTPEPPPAPDPYQFYVDATAGSDNNEGGADAPFRTITRALQSAQGADKIKVRDGTYGDGESFPLRVPDSVSLIGDTTRVIARGETPGEDVVLIVRDLSGVSKLGGLFGARPAIVLGNFSKIEGFAIDVVDSTTASSCAILLEGSVSSILESTVKGAHTGVVVAGSAGATSIQHCLAHQNETGARVLGARAAVSSSVFVNNDYGVVIMSQEADLGGGIRRSTGGNRLTGNRTHDLLAFWNGTTSEPLIVYARDNYWDVASPTVSDYYSAPAGADVVSLLDGTVVLLDGAQQAGTSPALPPVRPAPSPAAP